MARWRLMQAHYLPVAGTEWEEKVTSRTTGKQVRKVWTVPMYCDEGTIVSYEEDRLHPNDIIFTGPPTPDMEPIDDAAETISAQHRPAWVHPIEGFDSGGADFGSALIAKFEKMMSDVLVKPTQITGIEAVSAGSVSKEEFDELKALVKSLTAQLSMKAEAEAISGRRA